MIANSKLRVLILGEDTQSFLTVIRSLGAAGMEIHIAWCPLDSAALASRYVHTVHRMPPYQAASSAWITAFEDLIREQRFDLILPTTDGTTLPFQLHRERFEKLARIYLLPDEVYRICADKGATWDLAASLEIPLPRQRLLQNAEEARDAAAEFGYPLVLKPSRSAHESDPLRHQAVKKVGSETALLKALADMLPIGPPLVQEHFLGEGLGVEVLCNQGRILLAFQHERVHERPQGGGSSYRKSVAIDPELLAATAKLMQALCYTGVAMVEFKQNHETGRWILIEINARFWGSIALSRAAGLDFPLALVSLLLEGQENFPQQYRTGIYCRHWTRDLQWWIKNIPVDKSDKTLHSRSVLSTLLEIRHILALREFSDTFVFSDPRPAWVDLEIYFDDKFFGVLKHLKPFRTAHQRRLKKLFAGAERIVVVCHGNICRSPYAGEFLTNRMERSAISRGVYIKTGRPSPENAIISAEKRGIDLQQHRSALVTPDELKDADLILIFDRRNWLSIRALAPECMDRVAYLGASDPDQPLEIGDPYGGDVARFDRCYVRIETALQSLGSLKRQ